MSNGHLYEAAIIGAGPIGLETAALLRRENIDYVHFEKEQIGATVQRYPPLTQFFSSADRLALAGVPIPMVDRSKCTREEYLAYLRSFVVMHDLQVRTGEEVVSVERREDGTFALATKRGIHDEQWTARRVIFAHGDMAAFNRLDIPGEDLPHVHHVLGDVHEYFDRSVVVVGGRNSAVEAALRCYHAGARVSISYRKHRFEPGHVKYWLLPELEGRIARGEIACYHSTQPVRITDDAVDIVNIDSGEHLFLQADRVLLLTGYRPDNSLPEQLGVHFTGEDSAPVFNPDTMESNVSNVFIAGTAVAGRQQTYRIFIENCHVHAVRITAAITGKSPPQDTPEYGYLRES
jgi:thioredoxin reductase (NADPH)